MEWLTNPEIWIAFFTLTALEIVLGIDNIIMIAILVGRMPPHMQAHTRFFGLALAMVTRIMLLLSITWIMRLTNDLFQNRRSRIFRARSDPILWRAVPAMEKQHRDVSKSRRGRGI